MIPFTFECGKKREIKVKVSSLCRLLLLYFSALIAELIFLFFFPFLEEDKELSRD